MAEQQGKTNALFVSSLKGMPDPLQFEPELFLIVESLRLSLDFLEQEPECGKSIGCIMPFDRFAAHVVIETEVMTARETTSNKFRSCAVESETGASKHIRRPPKSRCN